MNVNELEQEFLQKKALYEAAIAEYDRLKLEYDALRDAVNAAREKLEEQKKIRDNAYNTAAYAERELIEERYFIEATRGLREELPKLKQALSAFTMEDKSWRDIFYRLEEALDPEDKSLDTRIRELREALERKRSG